ncbi:MAG: hypothetical protein RRA92_08785 [Gemmatimonadota bacterium]|nr:hypothetical protein [Gemmatimonadota bacterium]
MKRMCMLAAALLVIAGAEEARGQALNYGPQISIADDADFGIGGRLQLPLVGIPLTFAGSFDVFFPDGDVDYWEINGNLMYDFRLPEAPTVTPYVGGGINIAHVSVDRDLLDDRDDTDAGLNLLGGLRFDLAPLQPFIEAKFEIEGGEQFILTGGLLF